MMDVVIYAYPWDVVGDPEYVERISSLGVKKVALAAYYHGVRAATPMHPQHKTVDAPRSALYFSAERIRRFSWGAFAPRPAGSWAEDGSFEKALEILTAQGIEVYAWSAPMHGDNAGADTTIVNAAGDRLGYALCPRQQANVQFASDVIRITAELPVDGTILEAFGFMGMTHDSLHDKTQDAGWDAFTQDMLSVCYCAACVGDYRQRGLPVDRLRETTLQLASAQTTSEQVHDEYFDELTELVESRVSAAEAIARDVGVAARDAGVRIVAAHYNPGARPLDRLSTRLVGFDLPDPPRAVLADWGCDGGAAATYRRLVGHDADDVGFAVYVHAGRQDWRNDPRLPAHFTSLWKTGLTQVHLYHSGLVAMRDLQDCTALLAETYEASTGAKTDEVEDEE